jgi:hypothetical protein
MLNVVETYDDGLNNVTKLLKKGSNCSREGSKYEHKIFDIVKNCKYEDHEILFNTQKESDLGGCDSKNDIICNFNVEFDTPIEIKKCRTPDWMQCMLKYDIDKKLWHVGNNNKIVINSKHIFDELIGNLNLFNGKIPDFVTKKISYNEWTAIKKNTSDFNDVYFECPNDTISRLYAAKGCKYIQISTKGLYYLENDICDFNVNKFLCDQRIRIRIKVHTRCDKNKFCKLSVMASCQPKNISDLENSEFSLDDVTRLPKKLIYI